MSTEVRVWRSAGVGAGGCIVFSEGRSSRNVFNYSEGDKTQTWSQPTVRLRLLRHSLGGKRADPRSFISTYHGPHSERDSSLAPPAASL